MDTSSFQSSLSYYEAHIETGKPFYMDAEALVDIIEHYSKANRGFEAERCMRFAMKLHPENDEVRISQAYRLKAETHWDEAHKLIALVSDQKNRDVQLFYVEEFVASGCLQEAEALFVKALPEFFTDVDYDWFIDMAEICLDYGYYDRALIYLNRVPAGTLDEKHCYELQAEAFLQLGRKESAEQAAQKMVDIDPYDPISWTQLADIRQKCELYEESVDACDYALAIRAGGKQALLIKALSLNAMERSEEALETCKECIKCFPFDFEAYLYAGEVLYDNREFEEARNMLCNAMRYSTPETPERSRIVSGLAYCNIGLNNDDVAIELLKTNFQAGLSPVEVNQQAAILFFELDKQAKAVELLLPIMQSEAYDAATYRRFIEMLTQYRCYRPAVDIWTHIFNDTTRRNPEFLPQMAFAARELHETRFYLGYLAPSVLLNPHATEKLFADAFNNAPISEYLELAQREVEGWNL